jgi:AcrR family transcriptional regulator
MSWTGQKRGYHHGNLREALVEAAMALIAESGPAGFTIAEAARRAGVSPAAPYRHFRDAEALLAEVALRGFDALSLSLARAWRDGNPEPILAFENIGRAYLAFARTEPAFYAAMFEARINAEAHPGLLTARNDHFGGAQAGAAACPDGRPACLGDGAWRRLALRPQRCRPAETPDVAGGPAGGGLAALPAKPGIGRGRAFRLTKLCRRP